VQALAEEASARSQTPAAREAEILLLLRGLCALVEVDARSQVCAPAASTDHQGEMEPQPSWLLVHFAIVIP
jgi:hypothetical protein